MSIELGTNGLGRIGRNVFQIGLVRKAIHLTVTTICRKDADTNSSMSHKIKGVSDVLNSDGYAFLTESVSIYNF
jgi:glyceraldehyde-3-phosphate dehydrogenase/erythrose-4-phosphate dehydrogenase